MANVNGERYPERVEDIVRLLDAEVAAPVQFVKGLQTLYDAGARVFVADRSEAGTCRVRRGRARDDDVVTPCLRTNHPKLGDVPSFNQALCGLWPPGTGPPRGTATDGVRSPTPLRSPASPRYAPSRGHHRRRARAPGGERLFDDANVRRILDGEQLIDVIPSELRRRILDKHITRLVKGENGSGSFEAIDDVADVIKLAARAGELDLAASSASTRISYARSGVIPSWRSPPGSTRCATPACRSSSTTARRARTRSCRTAGACPTHSATTRA